MTKNYFSLEIEPDWQGFFNKNQIQAIIKISGILQKLNFRIQP